MEKLANGALVTPTLGVARVQVLIQCFRSKAWVDGLAQLQHLNKTGGQWYSL